jgi:hypothetical protein
MDPLRVTLASGSVALLSNVEDHVKLLKTVGERLRETVGVGGGVNVPVCVSWTVPVGVQDLRSVGVAVCCTDPLKLSVDDAVPGPLWPPDTCVPVAESDAVSSVENDTKADCDRVMVPRRFPRDSAEDVKLHDIVGVPTARIDRLDDVDGDNLEVNVFDEDAVPRSERLQEREVLKEAEPELDGDATVSDAVAVASIESLKLPVRVL